MATVCTDAQALAPAERDAAPSPFRWPALRTWMLVFLALGVGWRLLRYALQLHFFIASRWFPLRLLNYRHFFLPRFSLQHFPFIST